MSACGDNICDIHKLAGALKTELNKVVQDYKNGFKEAVTRANSLYLRDDLGQFLRNEDGTIMEDPDYMHGPLDGVLDKLALLSNSQYTYRKQHIQRLHSDFVKIVLQKMASLPLTDLPNNNPCGLRVMAQSALFQNQRVRPSAISNDALLAYLNGDNVNNSIGTIATQLQNTINNCCDENIQEIMKNIILPQDIMNAENPADLTTCLPRSVCPFIEGPIRCSPDVSVTIKIENIVEGPDDPCHILLSITLYGQDIDTNDTPVAPWFVIYDKKKLHVKDVVAELKKGAEEAKQKIKEAIDTFQSEYMKKIAKAKSVGDIWKSKLVGAFKKFQGNDSLADAISHIYFQYVNTHRGGLRLEGKSASAFACLAQSFNKQRDTKERCLNVLHRTNQTERPIEKWPTATTAVVPDNLPPNWAEMTQAERIAWADSNEPFLLDKVLDKVRTQSAACVTDSVNNEGAGNQQCCLAQIVQIEIMVAGNIQVTYRFPPSNLWRLKRSGSTVEGCSVATVWDFQQGVINLLNDTMLPGCDKSVLEGYFKNNTASLQEPYHRDNEGRYLWPRGHSRPDPAQAGGVDPTDCMQIPTKLPREFRETLALGLFFLTEIMSEMPQVNARGIRTGIDRLKTNLDSLKEELFNNLNIDNIIIEACQADVPRPDGRPIMVQQ